MLCEYMEKKLAALEICKILWWTFSIIFISLRAARFGNLFIGFHTTEDVVIECAETTIKSLADESRGIFETGKEVLTSN